MDPGGGQKISRAETLLGCGAFSDHLVHTKPFGLLERFGRNQGTKHSHLPWYQSGKSDHPCGTVPDPHCGAVWLGPGCQWRPRAFILHFFRPPETPQVSLSSFPPRPLPSPGPKGPHVVSPVRPYTRMLLRPKPAIQAHTGADKATCPSMRARRQSFSHFAPFPSYPESGRSAYHLPSRRTAVTPRFCLAIFSVCSEIPNSEVRRNSSSDATSLPSSSVFSSCSACCIFVSSLLLVSSSWAVMSENLSQVNLIFSSKEKRIAGSSGARLLLSWMTTLWQSSSLDCPTSRTLQAAAKAAFFYTLLVLLPANGSMYSLSVIWSFV